MHHTAGVHHIIMTVTDLARAQAFYGELLGFRIIEVPADHGGGFLFRTGEVMIFFNSSPKTPAGDRFHEFRVGLDHLAFTVADQETLQGLAERLIAAGVETKGVEIFAPTGTPYVAFRDPDNIQLEYWLTEK